MQGKCPHTVLLLWPFLLFLKIVIAISTLIIVFVVLCYYVSLSFIFEILKYVSLIVCNCSIHMLLISTLCVFFQFSSVNWSPTLCNCHLKKSLLKFHRTKFIGRLTLQRCSNIFLTMFHVHLKRTLFSFLLMTFFPFLSLTSYSLPFLSCECLIL